MSLSAKFQFLSSSRSSWKVCGGVGWWSRPSLGFSFSQAEQYLKAWKAIFGSVNIFALEPPLTDQNCAWGTERNNFYVWDFLEVFKSDKIVLCSTFANAAWCTIVSKYAIILAKILLSMFYISPHAVKSDTGKNWQEDRQTLVLYRYRLEWSS